MKATTLSNASNYHSNNYGWGEEDYDNTQLILPILPISRPHFPPLCIGWGQYDCKNGSQEICYLRLWNILLKHLHNAPSRPDNDIFFHLPSLIRFGLFCGLHPILFISMILFFASPLHPLLPSIHNGQGDAMRTMRLLIKKENSFQLFSKALCLMPSMWLGTKYGGAIWK